MSVAVRERPIRFTGAQVRAVLERRKTQLRRVVDCGCNHIHIDRLLGDWGLSTPPHGYEGGPLWRWRGSKPPEIGDWIECVQSDVDDHVTQPVHCPFGLPGDRLWIKESWATGESFGTPFVFYRATDDVPRGDILKPGIKPFRNSWRRASHMPRWASRITLRIESVRVERLNDISEADAIAEGIFDGAYDPGLGKGGKPGWCYVEGRYAGTPRHAFELLWDSINGDRPGCSWADNPWVWTLSFIREDAS